jgi:heme oxygenase
MRSYVARLEEIARTHPPLLAAHAYVRYMGDLSGGQILRDVVRRALDLQDDAGTAFYRFAGGDGREIKEAFRAALDTLTVDDTLAQEIVAEAREAFARHVVLFEELHRPAG